VTKTLALVFQLNQSIQLGTHVGHAAGNHHPSCRVARWPLFFGHPQHPQRALGMGGLEAQVGLHLVTMMAEQGAPSAVHALKKLMGAPKGK